MADSNSNDLKLIITTLQNHIAATYHSISETRNGVDPITWPLVDTAILNTAGKISMGFSSQSLYHNRYL